MNEQEIVRELRNVQEKHKNDFTPTFAINISEMARDCADCIESLHAQLAESQRREKAVTAFAIRAEQDYTECDKMFIHVGQLKQESGYNAYLVDAKQSGAIPLTFEQYLRGKE